jgi:hypothetical protein
MMWIYIVLAIPPDRSVDGLEIEVVGSEIQAENRIDDFKRYESYEGYTFRTVEKEIPIKMYSDWD